MTKKRDAAYYESRLKREFPKEYAQLRAGGFKSVRQAAAAAALIHLPTRLDALKREWKRAGARERGDFVVWIKSRGSTAATVPVVRPSIIDTTGHLKPPVVKFIKDWTSAKRVTPGRIMQEIGFSNFDYTLSHALRLGAPIRPEVIVPLKDWLIRNGCKLV
jgi:hypothetical protein